MKYRIKEERYRDGSQYYPQYKGWFFWWNFTKKGKEKRWNKFGVRDYPWVPVWFSSYARALDFIQEQEDKRTKDKKKVYRHKVDTKRDNLV